MGCGSSNGDNGSALTPTQSKRMLSIGIELGMTIHDVKKVHRCFRRCHINEHDKVDIETFATQNTVYPDVLFTCARLISSNSNELNFEEFFVCLYNLITHPTKELHTLIFQCFDVNEVSGTLTEEEIMHLITILWKMPKEIVLETLKQRTWQGPVSLGTFSDLCIQFPRMMMPVIDLQNVMIQNTVGHARAKILSEHRASHFSDKSMLHIVHDMNVKPSCYANMMKKVRKNDTLQPKQQRYTQSNVPEHIRDQANAIRSGRRSSDSVTSMASSQKSSARSMTESEKNNNREMLLSTHMSVPQPQRQRALSADKAPHHHRNIFVKQTNNTSWSSEKIDGVGYMDKTNRPKLQSQGGPSRALSADHTRKTKGKHYLPAPSQIIPIVDNNSNNDEDPLDKYVSSRLGVKPSLISSEKNKLRQELRKKISRGTHGNKVGPITHHSMA